MSKSESARNERIVRLRDDDRINLSFQKIADRIAVEFPDIEPISKERVRGIYNRDKLGIEDPGTVWRRENKNNK